MCSIRFSSVEVLMAFEDWEKLPDGSIKLYPLVGIDTFKPYGMMCGLRVQYVGSDAELQAVPVTR